MTDFSVVHISLNEYSAQTPNNNNNKNNNNYDTFINKLYTSLKQFLINRRKCRPEIRRNKKTKNSFLLQYLLVTMY